MLPNGTLSVNERDSCGVKARPLRKTKYPCTSLSGYLPFADLLITRRFLFMEKKRGFFYRLLFSKTLDGKTAEHWIAYIAVMAALASISNLFEIKFLDTQFSFTIFISATF